MGKADVGAADEIYEVAQRRANAELEKMKNEMGAVVDESKALGVLQKINYDSAHNKMFKYAVLYKVRQNKEYRKGGMTWEKFCEAIGEERRSVDRILNDMKPVYDEFSDKLSVLLGMPFNKIRYLGRMKPDNSSGFEDGCLIFDGQKIPIQVENLEEIEAAIDAMKESQQKEADALKTKVKKLSKNIEQAVKEETKALVTERKALLEQVDRLKVFDPKDKDPDTWSIEQIEVIQDLALKFTAMCRKFVIDERIKDELPIQGKVEGHMRTVELAFRELRQLWDTTFDLYEEMP